MDDPLFAGTRIAYVRFNRFTTDFHEYFGGGTQVRATGLLRNEKGRLVLTAQEIQAKGRKLQALPPAVPPTP